MADISEPKLMRAFALLEAAASNGARCPMNEPRGPVHKLALSKLARIGWIRIEVHPTNWRVVVILHGRHYGSRTAAPPFAESKPYLTIDENGSVYHTETARMHGQPMARNEFGKVTQRG